MNERDIAFMQQSAIDGRQLSGNGLSSVPYYIQELSRKLDLVNYKLDLLLSEKEKKREA